MSSVLILNGGSSSIKFALFQSGKNLERRLHGQIDRIGLAGTLLTAQNPVTNLTVQQPIAASDLSSAANLLVDWLTRQSECSGISAVGHRVVHGMHHTQPEELTRELIDELYRISPADPEHMPGEIALIEASMRRIPNVPQIACFDTAFHSAMPRVARLLPIPRRFFDQGIQRYGFHGLSYAYLVEELARCGDRSARSGRVILAHLGNGASLAAVRDGTSIDTSMGFTPTSGVPMGTRSGDLDPGLVDYLSRTGGMTVPQFHQLVNHESGLLGVSGISGDMRDLLAVEGDDERAAEAVALFCYQISKCIGAFAAALGGVDALIFAGGIGEHAPSIRARACARLGFLGISLDPQRNAADAAVISIDSAPVVVRVIRTDEEIMMARSVLRLLPPPSCPTPGT
jgi:acetate kinase